MRILLVEDERKVASFIARALRENSYAVDVAETGEKGLEQATDVTYDAILLDVRLPGMSGMELQRRLSGDGNPIPIIFITGHTDEALRKRALQDGALAFFLKPFSAQALLETISSTLK